MQNAIASGVTFAVAAGNSNANACSGSPNKVPEAITVGATTSSDARSSFSNFGACVDVFAPAIGNAHGVYKAEPVLDAQRVSDIVELLEECMASGLKVVVADNDDAASVIDATVAVDTGDPSTTSDDVPFVGLDLNRAGYIATSGYTLDARGAYLLPGFIQTHVHLCQTLFRGYADDLRLLEWLRRRIWPMEAAHTPASLAAATRLACHELLRSGTTSVLARNVARCGYGSGMAALSLPRDRHGAAR